MNNKEIVQNCQDILKQLAVEAKIVDKLENNETLSNSDKQTLELLRTTLIIEIREGNL